MHILLDMFPRAWKGKKFVREAASLLRALALQLELSVERWNFVPLRQLPVLLGPKGMRRKAQDHARKDEMMSCANRAGFALTASRLEIAKRVLAINEIVFMEEEAPTVQGLVGTITEGGATSSGASAMAPLVGAFAVAERERVHDNVLEDTMCLRDQTEYHWPVMFSYSETTRMWMGKPGPVHIAFDGVQADSLGELNSYWALTPARPWVGIPERSAFLPIQESLWLNVFENGPVHSTARYVALQRGEYLLVHSA